ncbi:MAG: glycosyltransferase family 39 protein [Chitinophagales bacterium]|nr:glycosyltransferase family 39 protein [Chitinophagales bacterium]
MKEIKKKRGKVQREKINEAPGELRIRYPFLWLTIAVLVLYLPSINFDFTELDDSIFIKEQQEYNSHLSNLGTSFKRGVFNETEDVYYRPLLLNSFILNYQISKTNIKGYHFINILLHLASVLLLFILLKKLKIKEGHSFVLTLFFAVHPVLSQAVAWIPGRNDTLLALFSFSFFILMLEYSESGSLLWLILHFITLIAAFFTKETGLFTPAAAFVMLVLIMNKKWLEKRNLILYASWLLAFCLWFYVRSEATLKNEQVDFSQIIKALPFRLPVIIQYFGKIILPINLSVFPIMKDTTYWFGIIAVAIMTAMLLHKKQKNWKVVAAGIIIYILFLLPVLLVPNTLNEQDFEHRLYLPMVGVLILLPETFLFKNNWRESKVLMAGIAVCAILAIVNFIHQKNFADPLKFWQSAVRTSPHSAYANMMLGARLDKVDLPRAQSLIKTAYALNPDEKYLNYYMGKMMLDKDSIEAAEKYFLKEVNKSEYYECYFHLARIAFLKERWDEAISYLIKYLSTNPADSQANNNLLLLYMQTNQIEKAKTQMQRMQQMGIEVPAEALQRLQ